MTTPEEFERLAGRQAARCGMTLEARTALIDLLVFIEERRKNGARDDLAWPSAHVLWSWLGLKR
jgi:hypothetical protein